jgi:xylulokinase
MNAGRAYEWAIGALARLEREQARATGRSVYDVVEPEIKRVPPGSNGLVFLPYLAGERSPFTDPNARGVFLGLSDKTTPIEMIRSAVEGVSYAIRQSMTAVGCLNRIREVVLIGGGSKSDTWAQILADVCECSILVPEDGASGPCLGAAVAAMVGMHILDRYSDVDSLLRISKRYECKEANAAVYRRLFEIYENLYPAVKDSFGQLAAAMRPGGA